MSGIAGIIRFDGVPVEAGLVEKMTAAMPYRGPDGIHHWVKGSVAMGQCMLHTTPESLEEKQPLTNEEENLVLVMDGRVDNWEELRRKLLGRGTLLRNRSDAELVLRAYQVWGEDCLPHIDGDFALVIWDVRRQEVFCARDRMGSKPFFYHWDGSTLSFASELHSVLDLPWVRQEINEGVLAEFLAAEWYSRDETLWSGILRLIPAHQCMISRQEVRYKQYWQPDLAGSLPYAEDKAYFEHYRELLTDNIRRLSRSHEQVAFEVSGGLDSSAIFCIAEQLRRSGNLLTPGIAGYTIAFTEDDRANELVYAQAVGQYLDVHINELSPSKMPLSWVDERARDYSYFPGFPNANMSQNMLDEVQLSGARVIMNGVGGDEWLCGSRTYYADELASLHLHRLYECFKSDVSAFGVGQAIKWFIRHGCFPLLPVTVKNRLRRLIGRCRATSPRDLFWLSPAMQERIRLQREEFICRPHQPVNYFSQEELLRTWSDAYRGLATEDAEMRYARFGLEIRRPLYTREFVQFAFSTPERLRMHGDRDKYIHVQALQSLMPKTILRRMSKAEFSVMFREHLDAMRQIFTVTLPDERSDWVSKSGMMRLFQHYQDNPHHGWPIWILWGIYGCDRLIKKW